MGDILTIIAPIFLVVAVGFASVRTGFFSIASVEGMMAVIFRLGFPCLIFREISKLDLAANFDPALLLSFYTGAITSFALGITGARLLFRRPWPDAVVIGFAALFSNCLLLGVPMSERAFGPETLGTNFAIISIHSPFCLTVGILAMQLVRSEGGSPAAVMKLVGQEIFRNPLLIGIGLAFIVNLGGITVWTPLSEAINLLASAAIPTALLGLGGVLTKCEPQRAFGEAAMVTVLSLIIHPLIVFGLTTQVFHLSPQVVPNAVLTAAMPTGLMAYVFAQLYGRATGAAASTVMFATVGSLISAPIWIVVLRSWGG